MTHLHGFQLDTKAAQRRQFLRRGAQAAALGLGAAAVPQWAWAGQLEEPLADSVRSALSASVRTSSVPPVPILGSEAEAQDYMQWLRTMSDRLAQRRSVLSELERKELLQTVWYEAKRARLDVSLVLGVITVESNFRKYAISPVGARGFMQIMPFWARVIGDGDPSHLFHMQTNLRFGCVILRHYLDRERGDEFMALGRYNGSRGKATYPNLVFSAQRNWV